MNSIPSGHALVTGSAMGLGKALCDHLRGDGWQVTTVDREPEAPKPNGVHLQCDLADSAALGQLLEKLEKQPPFDLVILNAGASATGRFEEMPLEAYQALVQLNAVAPMVMASSLARSGRLREGSRLLFVSSLSRFVGYPGAAVYAATKDAVAVYAKSIRKPFEKRGISVSCAFPGPLRTNHAARHSPPGAREEKRMSPQKAAQLILAGVNAGKRGILPGGSVKAFALFGRLLPSVADRVMRRLLFEKLNREVW